jgi:hypothetical protein
LAFLRVCQKRILSYTVKSSERPRAPLVWVVLSEIHALTPILPFAIRSPVAAPLSTPRIVQSCLDRRPGHELSCRQRPGCRCPSKIGRIYALECHCIAVSLKLNFLPKNLLAFRNWSGPLWMHAIKQTNGLWVNDRCPHLIIIIVN